MATKKTEHVQYDVKRRNPELGRKLNVAERSCSTPSALYGPQDWSKTPYSTARPCWFVSSPQFICAFHYVTVQHQAKPGVLENSLSSVLHVSDENVPKLWTRSGPAMLHLCRARLEGVEDNQYIDPNSPRSVSPVPLSIPPF